MIGRWKRLTVGLLVFVLAFGLILQPGSAQTGSRIFSDLNQSHDWALKHIAKMNKKGIIEGHPDGRFLPDQYVSQEQAIVMVVRAMGLEPETYSVDTSDVPAYRGVSSWASRHIAVADKHDLLRWEEESRFQGRTAATRQWIAQLMVRMIGLDDEAESYKNLSSSFADKEEIDDWAKGYVNLAASEKYGLIKGYAMPNGSFNFAPENYVRRIELATLLSRAEKYLPIRQGSETQGTILTFNGDEMIVQTAAGNKRLFTSNQTLVFSKDKLVSLSSLERFQPVLILGSPTAEYIEILDEAEIQEEVSGSLVKADEQLKFIAIKSLEGEIKTYPLGESVRYHSKGGPIQLADLKEGEMVELTLKGNTITTVYRLSEDNQSASTGTIYDIDLTKQLITIQSHSGTPMVYSISPDAKVQYPDSRLTGLNGLRKGMKVELVIENSMVTSVKVETIVEEGTVRAVSSDGIITYKTNSGMIQAYQLAQTAVLKMKDGSSAVLSDIKVDDQVIVHVESNGIVSLEITNRTAENNFDYANLYVEGTVIALDKTSKTLILKLKDDKLASYKYDSVPELYINGKNNPTLDDIKQDMKAKIQLFNDKISYIEVDNRVEGTVDFVDPIRNVMTLVLANNERWIFKIDKNCEVNIRHESYADLSDIQRNDFVRVNVTENNVITEIDVRRDIAYIVTDIYEYSKRIYVKDERNNSYSLYLNAAVQLTVPGQTRPGIEDVKEDDIVKATFIGDDLKAVEVLPSYRGRITNINTSKAEFTVEKNDGSTVTLPFGSGDLIKYKTNEYTQLSNLAVGDRVEIRQWLGGRKRINKMEKIDATYKYKDSNFVYVNSEARSYKFAQDVFVRQRDQGVTLDALKRDQSITMYLMNNMVYEIHIPN